jgi:hypothetical protein
MFKHSARTLSKVCFGSIFSFFVVGEKEFAFIVSADVLKIKKEPTLILPSFLPLFSQRVNQLRGAGRYIKLRVK